MVITRYLSCMMDVLIGIERKADGSFSLLVFDPLSPGKKIVENLEMGVVSRRKSIMHGSVTSIR